MASSLHSVAAAFCFSGIDMCFEQAPCLVYFSLFILKPGQTRQSFGAYNRRVFKLPLSPLTA